MAPAEQQTAAGDGDDHVRLEARLDDLAGQVTRRLTELEPSEDLPLRLAEDGCSGIVEFAGHPSTVPRAARVLASAHDVGEDVAPERRRDAVAIGVDRRPHRLARVRGADERHPAGLLRAAHLRHRAASGHPRRRLQLVRGRPAAGLRAGRARAREARRHVRAQAHPAGRHRAHRARHAGRSRSPATSSRFLSRSRCRASTSSGCRSRSR